MIKNKSSQVVQAFLISKEGDAVATGTTTVKVIGDGVSTDGAGTVTNTGSGIWTYEPSQAETNFNDVIYLFANVLAVTQPVQYAPTIEVATVDVVAIAGDSVAPSNLADTYNGVGFTDDNAPAKQSQLANLANVGSAINTPSTGLTLTLGNEDSGTYADTAPLDGVYNVFTDNSGNLDVEYTFMVGGDGVPSRIQITGYLTGGNDELDVLAYNGSTYDKIGIIEGRNSENAVTISLDLYTTHVQNGTVKIKFFGNLLTTGKLGIDQMFVAYSTVTRTVGYANGAVWLDTITGTAGTELYVNGVADHASNSLDDAKAIADNLGIKNINVANGSSLVLTEDMNGYNFMGGGYFIDANGFNLSYSNMSRAWLTGTLAISGAFYGANDCIFTDVSTGICYLTGKAYIEGAFTMIEAGDYQINGLTNHTPDPFELVYANVGTINVSATNTSMLCTIKGMKAGDTMYQTGAASITLDASCTGGMIVIAGEVGITDNSGGAVTVVYSSYQQQLQQVLDNTNELQQNQGDWLTATGFATVNPDNDSIAEILADTTELQQNQIDISGLSTFDHTAHEVSSNLVRIAGGSDIVGDGSTTPYNVS